MRFRSQTRELTKELGRPWPLCHCGLHMDIHLRLQKRPSATRHCPVIFKSFMGESIADFVLFLQSHLGKTILISSILFSAPTSFFLLRATLFFLATSIQNYFKSSVAYFTEKSKVYSGPDRQPESTMPMEKSTKQRSEGRRPAVKIGEFSHLKGNDCYQTLDTK